MNNEFAQRVRAAAVAGWWTLLVAWGFLTLSWGLYLALMTARPSWALSLWGPDLNWAYFQNVGFWLLAVFKICLYLLALLVVWLTIWASKLRKLPRG